MIKSSLSQPALRPHQTRRTRRWTLICWGLAVALLAAGCFQPNPAAAAANQSVAGAFPRDSGTAHGHSTPVATSAAPTAAPTAAVPTATPAAPVVAPAASAAPSAATDTPEILYGSYLGGSSSDTGKAVALDAAGNIYVLGQTYSGDLLGGDQEVLGYSDVYVAKFNPAGTQLLYLKVIGGKDSEGPVSLTADAQGNVYATVYSYDDTFPLKNPLWKEPVESSNGVLFKLDPNGNLIYSTYLPIDFFYSRHNVAADSQGNVYVTGTYPFVEEDETFYGSQIGLIKINANGSQVLLEKHIGGSRAEHGIALALDAQGNVYMAGTIEQADDFPVTANAHQPVCGDVFYDPETYCYEDGVVVVVNAAGEVTYASYHGGSFTDEPQAIVTDGKGLVVIAGKTTSAQFPLLNALQETCPVDPVTENCYSPRGFVSAIRLDGTQGTLVYSTYLGSKEKTSWTDVLAATMDAEGNAYIGGYTSGKQFPTLNPFQAELYESFCDVGGSERYCFDSFIVKFAPDGEMTWGSYLGAVFDDYLYGMTLDQAGMLYVTGTTEGYDFPTTSDGFQPTSPVGDDGFLVKIGPAPDDGGNTPPPGDGGNNPPPGGGENNPPPDDGGNNPPGAFRMLLPALIH